MEDINQVQDSTANKIISLLEDIKRILKEIADNPDSLDGWFTEAQIQKALDLKTTSLWTLRKLNQIKFSKIGSKTYYSIDSILQLLEKNQNKI